MREKIRKLVGSKACDMVKAVTVEIVKTGNVTGMKYLFEMTGLLPSSGQETEKEPMTRVLFKRLGLPKERRR